MEGIIKSFGWILFDAVFFVSSILFLAIGSWKATRTRNMSSKLRLMQQKFLIQLCLQALAPFSLVIGPIVLVMLLIIFDIFGYQCKFGYNFNRVYNLLPGVMDTVFCSLSLFSIISAFTLFTMNPTYHTWLTRRFIRKGKKLHSNPSVKIVAPS